MAKRRYKKSRRGGSKKLPLAIAVPVALPIIDAAKMAMSGGTSDQVLYKLMGFNSGGVDKAKVVTIAAPILGGIVAHKVAGKYVNRYLPKWLPVSI